jgi:hypothetical protein
VAPRPSPPLTLLWGRRSLPDVGQHRHQAGAFDGVLDSALEGGAFKGYKDAAHLKQDKDLDPLRDRDDFQKLLGEVAAKAEEKEPLSWPRAPPVGERGHPSLLVDEEVARAVRQESAAAVRWWRGVSVGVVWRWGKALGVTRTNNPGTVRRQRAASQAAAEVARRTGRSVGAVYSRRSELRRR